MAYGSRLYEGGDCTRQHALRPSFRTAGGGAIMTRPDSPATPVPGLRTVLSSPGITMPAEGAAYAPGRLKPIRMIFPPA